VRSVVEEVLIFREDLKRLAKEGEMFSFEKHALNVTIDVIGKVVL
jgi:hypothetical protein